MTSTGWHCHCGAAIGSPKSSAMDARWKALLGIPYLSRQHQPGASCATTSARSSVVPAVARGIKIQPSGTIWGTWNAAHVGMIAVTNVSRKMPPETYPCRIRLRQVTRFIQGSASQSLTVRVSSRRRFSSSASISNVSPFVLVHPMPGSSMESIAP